MIRSNYFHLLFKTIQRCSTEYDILISAILVITPQLNTPIKLELCAFPQDFSKSIVNVLPTSV